MKVRHIKRRHVARVARRNRLQWTADRLMRLWAADFVESAGVLGRALDDATLFGQGWILMNPQGSLSHIESHYPWWVGIDLAEMP